MQSPLPGTVPDTPSAVFERIATQPGAYWLDSGPVCGPHARYHLLGCNPSAELRPHNRNPFECMRTFLEPLKSEKALPIPAARVVGYLAYDLGRFIEQVPHSKSPQYDELVLNQYDACVTFDMSLGRAWLSASSTAAASA